MTPGAAGTPRMTGVRPFVRDVDLEDHTLRGAAEAVEDALRSLVEIACEAGYPQVVSLQITPLSLSWQDYGSDSSGSYDYVRRSHGVLLTLLAAPPPGPRQ